MSGLKKKIYLTGIAAFVLLGIALSNSALIRYIDAAYSTLISSDLETRKEMNRCSMECAYIQSCAIDMLFTCDSTGIAKLHREMYQAFSRVDRDVGSLAGDNEAGISHTAIISLQNACLAYRQACADYVIIISAGNVQNASDFARLTLQKTYSSLSGSIEKIHEELASNAEKQSRSLAFKNSMMSKLITEAGIIPIVFWCSGALILLSFAIRNRWIVFSRFK